MDLLVDILEETAGMEAIAIDGERRDVVDAVVSSQPDVLVVDLWVGRDPVRGWDIAQKVRDAPGLEGLPVLICTADLRALEDATAGVNTTRNVAALSKPFEVADFTAAVSRLLSASPPR